MRLIDQDTGLEFSLFNSDEECTHPHQEIGIVKYKKGSTHVQQCCLDCGAVTGSPLAKSTHSDVSKMIDFEMLRNKYALSRRKQYDAILQKHVRLQKRKDSEFQKEYVNYSSSDKWKEKRDLVMKRANYVCEGCLEKPASVVHHRSYRNIYSEMLFDLAAVYRECHSECHFDKTELTDDAVFIDDLPCYCCRWHGENDEGSWCSKFDGHTVIALTDRNLCGPKADALDPPK